jgi:hypothetical protein
MLRLQGCQLPVEVWYLGDEEGEPEWIELVRSLGVTCINAVDSQSRSPISRWDGWRLKSHAVLHSRFSEVLFLDADNVPLVDPTYLFDSPEYGATGAVFWPDFSRTSPGHPSWQVFGLDYRDEPEFESGQFLINKARSWQGLSLCDWYNQHADFYYRIIYGDKDTFRFAWHKADRSFAMPPTPPVATPGGLAQHDFQGRVIFQHRTGDKWSIVGNRCSQAFPEYKTCLEFLAELRSRWRPARWLARSSGLQVENVFMHFAGSRQYFSRVGLDVRPLAFGVEGRISAGASRKQCFWWCDGNELTLADDSGQPSAKLLRRSDGSWHGKEIGPAPVHQIRVTPDRLHPQPAVHQRRRSFAGVFRES